MSASASEYTSGQPRNGLRARRRLGVSSIASVEGTALCATCEARDDATARFCGTCGSRLAPEAELDDIDAAIASATG